MVFSLVLTFVVFLLLAPQFFLFTLCFTPKRHVSLLYVLHLRDMFHRAWLLHWFSLFLQCILLLQHLFLFCFTCFTFIYIFYFLIFYIPPLLFCCFSVPIIIAIFFSLSIHIVFFLYFIFPRFLISFLIVSASHFVAMSSIKMDKPIFIFTISFF